MDVQRALQPSTVTEDFFLVEKKACGLPLSYPSFPQMREGAVVGCADGYGLACERAEDGFGELGCGDDPSTHDLS